MKKKITEKEAHKVITNGGKTISQKDMEEVLKKEKEIEQKIKKGPLSEYINDIKIFIELLKDFVSGKYRKIPWFTIAAIVVALLYVLNPMDLVPDFIPVIGQLDDAVVIAVCIKLVKEDIENYKNWKMQ